MEIFLTALYFLLLCKLIQSVKFFRVDGLAKSHVLAAFALKVMAGLAMWMVYSLHYADAPRETLDTFKYFDDAGFFHSALSNDVGDYVRLLFGFSSESGSLGPYYEGMNHWQHEETGISINDNRTMIRLNALIHLISFGYYQVHLLLFNFLSFVGLLLCFKSIRRINDLPAWLFIVAFVLPPSLLFWGSGILKESVLFFSFGVFLNGFTRWYQGRDSWSTYLFLVLGLLLLISIRPYVLLACAPGVLFLILQKKFKKGRVALFIAVHLFSLLTLYASSCTRQLNLVDVMSNKRDAFVSLAEEVSAASFIDIPTFDSFREFMVNMPGAVFRCLCRPGVWESDSILLLFAGVENLVYAILVLLALLFLRKNISSKPFIFFCLSFVLVMSVIIGSVTPVLGAIVRYKVPILPFLLVLIYLLMDVDRIRRYFSFLRPS